MPASFLAAPFPGCPLCAAVLKQLSAAHWRCGAGHSFDSTRALIAALRAVGWSPRVVQHPPHAGA